MAGELVPEEELLDESTLADTLLYNPDTYSLLDKVAEESEISDNNLRKIHKGMLWLPTPNGQKTIVRVHPTAVLGKDIRVGMNKGPIGQNTIVGEGSLILGALYNNIELGKNVTVGGETRIGSVGVAAAQGKIVIEDEVNIKGRVRIHSPNKDQETRIGRETCIGSGVRIGEVHTKSRSLAPVTIGTRAIIGSDVVIRPGVHIGEGTEIASGYSIAENVQLPAGIRIRFRPSRPSRKALIGQNWQKELEHYIDPLD